MSDKKSVKKTTFKGISIVTVDSKGRMAMPSRYRDILAKECKGSLVITVDRDGCLLIYPQNVWEGIEKQLLDLPSMDKYSRFIQRLVLGHATECDLDGQGRLLLPSALREMGGIEQGNVVLLGQGNKFELWNQEKWTDRCNSWMHGSNLDEANINAVLESIRL